MRWSALAALALVACAGCATEAPVLEQEIAPPPPLEDVAVPVQLPPEPAASENTPPAARLVGNAHGGVAPATLTFSVDAADADGDAIGWRLDVDGDGATDADGNGTALPFSLNASYDSPGAFVARLVVSDGHGETSATWSVDIVAAPVHDPIVFEGTLTCVPMTGVPYYLQDLFAAIHAVELPHGLPVIHIELSYPELGPGINDLDLYVTDPAGTRHRSNHIGPEPVMSFPHPPGGPWSFQVRPYSCGGQVDYVLTLAFA